MKYIALLFHAPIQSWGGNNLAVVNANSPRKTENIPTKSAVEGFLRSALGLSRGENSSVDTKNLRFLIRVDRPGKRGRDYQVAQRSYLKNGVETNKEIPKEILMDATFLVLLGHQDESVIETLSIALENPVFAPFYGRRSHVPSLPPYLGIIETDNPRKMLEELPAIWGRDEVRKAKNVNIYDSAINDLKTIDMQDEIIDGYHPLDGVYASRTVGITTISLKRPERMTNILEEYKELYNAIHQ